MPVETTRVWTHVQICTRVYKKRYLIRMLYTWTLIETNNIIAQTGAMSQEDLPYPRKRWELLGISHQWPAKVNLLTRDQPCNRCSMRLNTIMHKHIDCCCSSDNASNSCPNTSPKSHEHLPKRIRQPSLKHPSNKLRNASLKPLSNLPRGRQNIRVHFTGRLHDQLRFQDTIENTRGNGHNYAHVLL